ncbi:hypothetical protein [Entomohabitans teleogrylli]|uniref:hypothetical protein n=1 Tax=Entomohabitans teleogrylli TaxID=1384589 RepID=UPI00073D21B8|nr:hypothetical protein [Entomohabitans teleogrylli]
MKNDNIMMDVSLDAKNRLRLVQPGDVAGNYGGGGGGDSMLEARVAKLESDVENIKTNLSEARIDISRLRESSANTSRDVAVILQKMVDFDANLSQKATKDDLSQKATKEDIQSLKADIHKDASAQTWKIVSAIIITVLIAILSKQFLE